MKLQNWSKEEDTFLINNYQKLEPQEISKKLNRTKKTVINRMYHLRKTQKKEHLIILRHRWRKEEDEFLQENYREKGAEWCSKRLNRTKESCKTRANLLGLKRGYYWTQEEIELLKKYYPKYGSLKLSKKLNRSRETITNKAIELGIKYQNPNTWTQEEENILRKYYQKHGAKYVSKLINKTETACQSKAITLKLKRDPYWTKEEKDFLKKHYQEKGANWVAKNLGKKSCYCRSMAKKNGLKYQNPKKWTKEEIEILKKYYPQVGKYTSDLIKRKNMSACIQKAQKLGIAYKKRDSQAVEIIKDYLEKRNIPYKQEIGFPTCKDKKMLLFDLAIYQDEKKNNLIGLIEYDGIQHFYPQTSYRSLKITKEEVFNRTRKHDKIKNTFCKVNNIPLLRIRYDQINIKEQIEDFLENKELYTKEYNSNYYNLETEVFKNQTTRFSFQNKKESKIKYLDFYVSKWTTEDELFLIEYYPEKGSKWVGEKLNRTPSSCINRAGKLGLKRKNKWTKKEDAFLIKYYTKKSLPYLEKKLKRTASSIAHRANRLGLKKKKKDC